MADELRAVSAQPSSRARAEASPEVDVSNIRQRSAHFAPDQQEQQSPRSTRPAKTNTGLSTASSVVHPAWEPQCVLSFDGGGIRGYSSLIIIKQLMVEIEEQEKSHADEPAFSSYHPGEYIPVPNYRRGRTIPVNESAPTCPYLPCHYFDYMGGTSTGGLISIMLSRLRMGIDECIEEYETLAGDVFSHPRWASLRGPIPAFRDKYDGARLQRVIEEVVSRRLSPAQRGVGGDTFSSPERLCKTVCVAYEQKPLHPVDTLPTGAVHVPNAGPYLFRSYDHWGVRPPNPIERNTGTAHRIPIWEVARATSAAPFYFDPITIQNRKFGDGGFGTNNPTTELFWEVSQMHGNDPSVINLMLSIGTGRSELSRFANGKGKVAKFYTYLKAAKKLASDSEAQHEQMTNLSNAYDLPYYRLNVPVEDGLGNMKLDEWKKTTLTKIRTTTERYCKTPTVRNTLKEVAEILVKHRREPAAADPDMWALVSTGVQYRCTVKKCRKSQKLRHCAGNLRIHLLRKHAEQFPDETEEEEKIREVIEKGKCAY